MQAVLMNAMISGDDEQVIRMLFEADDARRKFPPGYDHRSREAKNKRFNEWYAKLKAEDPETFSATRDRRREASKKWYERVRSDPEYMTAQAAKRREKRAASRSVLKNTL
jgi:hypothetical protein